MVCPFNTKNICVQLQSMIKKLAIVFAILCILLIGVVIADRIAAKSFESDQMKVQVEIGDILFRSYFYILASGRFYNYSGLPGHMAIVISEGEIELNTNSMENIRVVEARYYDHTRIEKRKNVGTNPASENFGEKYLGRRFLLKTHLTSSEKKKLLDFYKVNLNKPYRLFAGKEDTIEYNCATFVRHAMINSKGVDIDSDGGAIFFPNDVFDCYLFKDSNRIQF